MGKMRELNYEMWIDDLKNSYFDEGRRNSAFDNIAFYRCKEAAPLLKELYKSKQADKRRIKRVLERLNEDFEVEPSGLDFPGNLTLEEIRFILPFLDSWDSFLFEWNRFEKNRILNAVEESTRMEVFRQIDYSSPFFSETEKNKKRLVEVLQLAEKAGEIRINRNPSPDEIQKIQKETHDYLGEFRQLNMNRLEDNGSSEKYEAHHNACLLALEKLPDLRINFKDYQEAFEALAQHSRRNGLLALEDCLPASRDNYLANGFQLVVDGTDPDLVKVILETHKQRLLSEYSQLLELVQKGILMLQDSQNPRIIGNLFLFSLPDSLEPK